MKKMMWLGLPFLLLAGCGTDETDSAGTGEQIEEVMVEFNTEQQAAVAEEVVLSVSVTQGDEAVEDADEVVYEVWESGDRDNSEMIHLCTATVVDVFLFFFWRLNRRSNPVGRRGVCAGR